jgi:hypothetical protein
LDRGDALVHVAVHVEEEHPTCFFIDGCHFHGVHPRGQAFRILECSPQMRKGRLRLLSGWALFFKRYGVGVFVCSLRFSAATGAPSGKRSAAPSHTDGLRPLAPALLRRDVHTSIAANHVDIEDFAVQLRISDIHLTAAAQGEEVSALGEQPGIAFIEREWVCPS